MKPYIYFAIAWAILLAFVWGVFRELTDDGAIQCATRWSGAPVKVRYLPEGGCQVSRDGSTWWPESSIKINLWTNK